MRTFERTLESTLTTKELSEFLEKFLDSSVSGVTSDSRQVKLGTIFVAVHGGTQDGHLFIPEAEKAGAVLIIGERDLLPSEKPTKIPYLKVPESREALAQAASLFYKNPSQSLLMIGVTGTSGKTTTTYLLESILQAAGCQVGVIGTINIRYGKTVIPSSLTTPDSVELQRILALMKSEGITAVVMEVSSHSLKQRRVSFIAFDGMIFSNLTPEHLDFHPTMEDYFDSKAYLFTHLARFSSSVKKHPVAVINSEKDQGDDYGKRLISIIQADPHNPLQVSCIDETRGLQVGLEGIRGELKGVKVHSSFTGQFNVSNIASAVVLSQALKIPNPAIEEGISQLKGVPGRLEKVENSHGIHVWVDYAHKPDALQKVLLSLRKLQTGGRLITVFGCGGDRDRQKRPIMGQIAAECSDHVFITSDNPRTEDPHLIIQQILEGTQNHSNITVESDRRKAITAALHFAKKGDLVLIAGKGHEDYQILGKKKVHFDDREVIHDAFLNYDAWKA